ncbi:hypothetical protein [Mesorhizobium sp. M7A.F.Ca.US.006.01.1.1]|uniref:hypothetical protein n=1 Tax=Mesorhizobium sp. M7A.F.Ca.US.006.01.1.1 TaxID=2496707 RepID=UPI0013E3C1F8|nr:hypothetical protein [Mesorhizobium sp. M7A.F.Ca.US.006.01.1.1]
MAVAILSPHRANEIEGCGLMTDLLVELRVAAGNANLYICLTIASSTLDTAQLWNL